MIRLSEALVVLALAVWARVWWTGLRDQDTRLDTEDSIILLLLAFYFRIFW